MIEPPHSPPGTGSSPPEADPGLELDQLLAMPASSGRATVTCNDYSVDRCSVAEVPDLDAFLAAHRPDWVRVRWINIAGLTNPREIHAMAVKYQLHPLAIEDMLQPGTRPKVESYPAGEGHHARTFIVARKIHLRDSLVRFDQLSFFAGEHTLLTFQESYTGMWDGVAGRIRKSGSRLRREDTGYLIYALLDAVVDHCFPVIEHYGERLQHLSGEVLDRPDPTVSHRIHHIKNELLLLRRELLPMREVIHHLQQGDHDNVSETTCIYLRDVHDHLVQIIESAESHLELADSLAATSLNASSQRLNEVMKVLTIIATVFMPLSFLASVFGMNFHFMPELEADWAYPWIYPLGFWFLCFGIVFSMMLWFRRNRWL